MKFFLILIAVYNLTNIYCQEETTIYYNSNWEPIKDKDNFFYYRVINNKVALCVKDYFKNGSIQMEGCFTDTSYKIYNGLFKFYYENGHLEKEINYENGLYQGQSKYYHENGKLYSNLILENDSLNGICYWYFPSGKISSKEEYLKGNRISAIFYNENGSIADSLDAEYNAVFENGDLTKFRNWLISNLEFPQAAADAGISGKVIIAFTVNKKGVVCNTNVLRSVHSSVDSATINVVLKSPKWKPGKIHNQISDRDFTLPIMFELTDSNGNNNK